MRRVVKLSGDLGGWPLWIAEQEDEDNVCGATTPDDWPMLSDALKRELIEWNNAFLAPLPRPRWRWRRETDSFVADAHVLAEKVQAELGNKYSVRWSA